GEQAPAAPDGFAPQWIGEHDPNNNGWIEWDVPLGREMDEPMVDPEVNEEVMDDDDWDDEVEWLMAPVTPPRTTMTVSSTYEIGGPSTAIVERPSSPLPAPRLSVPPTVIENFKYPFGEIHPRVATMGEQIQVMRSQTRQIVSRLKEIETRVQQNQQLWTRVTEMESHVGVVMSHMLWMEERLAVLEKRLPGPPPGPQ
nr:hypothetical protein [Tanacetum cinerariifolium]